MSVPAYEVLIHATQSEEVDNHSTLMVIIPALKFKLDVSLVPDVLVDETMKDMQNMVIDCFERSDGSKEKVFQNLVEEGERMKRQSE